MAGKKKKKKPSRAKNERGERERELKKKKRGLIEKNIYVLTRRTRRARRQARQIRDALWSLRKGTTQYSSSTVPKKRLPATAGAVRMRTAKVAIGPKGSKNNKRCRRERLIAEESGVMRDCNSTGRFFELITLQPFRFKLKCCSSPPCSAYVGQRKSPLAG